MAPRFSMRREYPALSALFFAGFLVVAVLIVTQFVGLTFDEPRFEIWTLRGLCVFLGACVIYPRFRAMGRGKDASGSEAMTGHGETRG